MRMDKHKARIGPKQGMGPGERKVWEEAADTVEEGNDITTRVRTAMIDYGKLVAAQGCNLAATRGCIERMLAAFSAPEMADGGISMPKVRQMLRMFLAIGPEAVADMEKKCEQDEKDQERAKDLIEAIVRARDEHHARPPAPTPREFDA